MKTLYVLFALILTLNSVMHAANDVAVQIHSSGIQPGAQQLVCEYSITAESDFVLSGMELLARFQGQRLPLTALYLYDGSELIGSSEYPVSSLEDNFSRGYGVAIFTEDKHVSAGKKKTIKVLADILDVPGACTLSLEALYFKENGYLYANDIISVETGWFTISSHAPTSYVGAYSCTVAPGSYNFQVPLFAGSDISLPVEVVDMTFVNDESVRIAWESSFTADPYYWDWNGYAEPGGIFTRLVAFGNEPLSFACWQFGSVQAAVLQGKPGDMIPIRITGARINDAEYPSILDGFITVGPYVTFGDANLDNSFSPLDLPAFLQNLYYYEPNAEQELKKLLSGDVDGNHSLDSWDLYCMVQKVFYPGMLFPIQIPYEYSEGKGKPVQIQKNTGLEARTRNGRFEVYAVGNITNGDIAIPTATDVEIGSIAGASCKLGIKNGKQLLVFAGTALDNTKPLFSVSSLEGITGFVNDHKVFNLSSENLTGLKDTEIPAEFAVSQNYPNPFNPSTDISYQLPEPGWVMFKVYDIAGKEVAVLVNEEKPAGNYTIRFNASGLASGTYVYVLKTKNFTNTKKMVLMK